MIEIAYKTLLDSITGMEATPAFSLGPYPAISYKVTPIQGGTIRSDQLEVRIIGEDFEDLAIIRDKIIESLDMESNRPSLVINSYAIRSQLAGGGWLFNDEIQMWELYPIFTTTWRCL